MIKWYENRYDILFYFIYMHHIKFILGLEKKKYIFCKNILSFNTVSYIYIYISHNIYYSLTHILYIILNFFLLP